ncbi:hypothetical protein VSDG_04771 [Cytospora chrysosperma]|uniref:Uncharacterized protein n=1 Tax=Cytospora chrysosperma TaxID=252740 RepID=A0A423W1U3_CYTCH|nr:hypothetical protein VSDG_04771 [Valsa sordida]
MTLLWNWQGFAFVRERTHHLDALLRQAQPYSVGRDVATDNVVACLRVLVALRQFRDLPGFERDIGQLFGWNQSNLVFSLQDRLVRGRARFLARHQGRVPPAPRLAALVDEWRNQPRVWWRITATRLRYYHRCLDAMRGILASPGTILNLTPTTTTDPALPRPPRPDWFRPRTRGPRQEEMELRLALENSMGLNPSAGAQFELPLRPGGQGIPQPRPQPQPETEPQPQPQPQPQHPATPAAAADSATTLVVAGAQFSIAIISNMILKNAEYARLAAPIIDAIKDRSAKATDQKVKDNLNAAMIYLEKHNDPKDLPSIKHEQNIFFAIDNEVGLTSDRMMGLKIIEA